MQAQTTQEVAGSSPASSIFETEGVSLEQNLIAMRREARRVSSNVVSGLAPSESGRSIEIRPPERPV